MSDQRLFDRDGWLTIAVLAVVLWIIDQNLAGAGSFVKLVAWGVTAFLIFGVGQHYPKKK